MIFYSAVLEQQKNYRQWDPMIFRDSNGTLHCFYLASLLKKDDKFWKEGIIRHFIKTKNSSQWEDKGTILIPIKESPWQSQRLMAGCIVQEKGSYIIYLFYSASPPDPTLLQENIGLAKSYNGGKSWKCNPNPLPIRGWDKYYASSQHPKYNQSPHIQKRDPYVVYDEQQDKYLMLCSASAKIESQKKGCIGLLVSDSLEGQWNALPPIVFPTIKTPQGIEGVYYECERPLIRFIDGIYHIFFSVKTEHINPTWMQEVGKPNRVTDFSIHHWVSEKNDIMGPYRVANVPIVKGSSNTNLYGISLF